MSTPHEQPQPRLTEAQRQRKAAEALAATAPPLGPQQRAIIAATFGAALAADRKGDAA